MKPSEQDIQAFIRATYRSIWAIELLCHVRARPDQTFSPEALVTALRASDLVVQQCVDSLAAAGLVAIEEAGHVRYAPASADLDALVAAAEALYAKSPNAVRRMIVAAATPGISAFADAFKLRRD